MAKVTAPLLSFGGGGTVAKSVTFAKWRGISYARQYAKPGNPNTESQQQTRSIFRTLSQMFLYSPAALIAAWDTQALGRPYTGRNHFQGVNTRALRSMPAKTSMEDFVASPGARGGLPPVSMGLTPGAGEIAVALALPDVPSDWTLVASHAVAFPDQAPAADFVGPMSYETETGTPETLTFTDLEDNTDYVVSAWLEWTKANGDTAYSISLTDTATTPA